MKDREPDPVDLNSAQLEPALAQLLARANEALTAGRPTDDIEREIAARFAAQSSAIIKALKTIHAAAAESAAESTSPQPRERGRGADTRTMAESVTWTGPTADGSRSRFARFELLGRIGAGGSGVVFRARDPQLGRLVALKVARAETLFSNEAKQRFTREARVLAALRHPNIIPVYEAGEADGLPYIVQELCDGPNLAAWLGDQIDAGRRLPIEIAARWALLTAQAVAHAHGLGIVHRDLKPANVLLEPTTSPNEKGLGAYLSADSCVPRITDFGIAKLFGSEESVTATLAVLGTAAYMAPEQAEGKTREVGAPADVYSLGVILYELLTGRRPIEGRNDIDTLRRLATDEPPRPSQLRSEVPRDLEAVCLKCLEKDPTRRYPTAAELASDLECFINGIPVAARPIGLVRRVAKACRRQRGAVRLGSAGVLVVLLTGLLLLQRLPKGAPTPFDRASLYTRDIRGAFNLWYDNAERLRDDPHAGEEMATLLASHIPGPGEVDRRGFDWQYLWRLCHPARAVGLLPRVASLKGHTGDVYYVTFSRDGSRIASAGRDRTARIWDIATQREVCVCSGHTDEVNWVDFSPDQTLLATAGEDHTIKIWDAATGKERFTLNGHSGEVVCVLFDQSGKRLISGDHRGVLKLWNLSSKSELKSIPAHVGRIQCISLAADGRLLASVGEDEIVRLWGMPDMVPAGAQRSEGAHSASLNRDVELIASGGGGTIKVHDVRTGGLRSTFSHHLNHIESVRFSPDGRQLASCAGDGMLRLWDLASRQGWAAVAPRFTDLNSEVPVGLWCVAYSPDGRQLASSARDGLVEIYDTSVTPQWTLIANSRPRSSLRDVTFSPDGNRLAIAWRSDNRANDGYQIWDLSRTRPGILCDVGGAGACAVSFSRDGGELAVGFEGKVEIVDAETGRRRRQIDLPSGSAGSKVEFGLDGSLYVAQGPTGRDVLSLHNYDAKTGSEIRTIGEPFYNSGFGGIAFGHRRDLVATWHAEKASAASLYELSSGRLRSKGISHRRFNDHYAFAPFEPILAISVQGGVELWDTVSCREIGFLPGLAQTNGPVQFSADGRLVMAVAPEQRSVHVWDVRTREELFTLPLPRDVAAHARHWLLAVCPNGQRIACSMTDDAGNGGIYLFSGLSAAQGEAQRSSETAEAATSSDEK